MTNEELKLRVGSNIARLRKRSGMTQAELAERINYSDKAVSKWERAESMPDVLTLMQLAEQFGTDMNELLGDPDGAKSRPAAPEPEPEAPAQPEPPAAEKVTEKLARYKSDRSVIQKLSSLLVWIVAMFIYLVTDAFEVKHGWMVFVFAVIANAIVLLSLRSAWKLYGMNRILISVIMWGSLLFIYLTVYLVWNVSMWKIFLMGIPGQIAIILWCNMFRNNRKEDNHG